MKTLTTLLSPLYLLTWLFTLSLLTTTHAADLTFTPVTPAVEVGPKTTLTVSGASGQVTWSAQKGWIVGVSNQVTLKHLTQQILTPCIR